MSKRLGLIFAAVVACSLPSLEVLEERVTDEKISFPYVPGLLTFREGPAVAKAFEKLASTVDCAIFDGQGYAHPLRFGLASHMGLLLDVPAIGCAKSRLIGEYEEPASNRGSWTPLIDKEEIVGAVVRTRDNVAPVFVSAGHDIDLAGSVEMVLACSIRFRLPEPIRLAHRLAGAAKRAREG